MKRDDGSEMSTLENTWSIHETVPLPDESGQRVAGRDASHGHERMGEISARQGEAEEEGASERSDKLCSNLQNILDPVHTTCKTAEPTQVLVCFYCHRSANLPSHCIFGSAARAERRATGDDQTRRHCRIELSTRTIVAFKRQHKVQNTQSDWNSAHKIMRA